MVTRLSTPMLPPPPMGLPLPRPANAPREDAGQPPAGGLPSFSTPNAPNPSVMPPPALATVPLAQSRQAIPLRAVLQDFRSTMNALGADPKVASQVGAYLKVVQLQAREPSPNVPLMRQMLLTAGQSLDRFIGQVLQQPSTVVTEWVNALMAQDIDYRLADAEDPLLDDDPPERKRSPLNAETTRAFREALVQARTQAQSGDWDGATETLSTLLASVTEEPKLEGRALEALGQVQAQQGGAETALESYRQAAARFSESREPVREGRVLLAMGRLYARQQQWAEAETVYAQAVELLRPNGDAPGLARGLTALGQAAARQGKLPQARDAWAEAVELVKDQPSLSPRPLGELWDKLGTTYRRLEQPGPAEAAYQAALKAHLAQKNQPAYLATLHQLAALHAEQGRLAEAQAVFSRIQRLAGNASPSC